MASEELLTRDEVLGGMPAQRARTLLFLIENRTAHLVAQSRRAMLWDQTHTAARQQDLDFLEAFAAGKDPPLRPTIQDLERFTPQWQALVPDNPALRAALAKLLGEKYTLVGQAIPNLRRALALDDPSTQQAYRRQQRQPLEAIYAPRAGLAERIRWLQAGIARRFDSLSPFWTAFSLTLTETVGVGILALPIALAGIGPLPGIVLIILMGIVNLLTIAYMAESVARSGEIRYGNAYFGRLVSDLLGRDGSLILRLSLVMIYALALLAYFIGLSTTLAQAVGLPAIAWTSLVFLVNLYFLRKESLNATVSAALLVGLVNISLILAICLISLPSLNLEYLMTVHLPLLDGEPFDPSLLALVFGTILLAFFGHTSLGNCARVVLQRDPSARSLIWGSIVAQIAAMALYSVWILAVNGVVAPQVLAAQTGTALIPLAEQVGPTINLLGSAFVILAMGMGSIHYSLGFYNLMREWLPRRRQPEITLSRRQGRLVLEKARQGQGLRIGLDYQGLIGGQAHFYLDVQSEGKIYGFDLNLTGKVDCWQLFKPVPGWQEGSLRLALELISAGAESAHVRIDSNLAVTLDEEWRKPGILLGGLLDLPEEQRRVVEKILRLGEATLPELALETGLTERFLGRALDSLTQSGYLRSTETSQGRRYRLQLAPRRGARLPERIWQALESGPPPQAEPVKRPALKAFGWLQEVFQNETSQFLLGASPVAAIFLVTVWLLATGQESFTRPISFLGLIVVSLLGGAFPVLLLVASRRKGEVIPQVVYRSLGNPLLLAGVYLVGVGGLFLHGLVIWQSPFERLVALLTGILILAMTLTMYRRGVFQPRAIVELIQKIDQPDQASLTVTISGRLIPAETILGYPDGEQQQGLGNPYIHNLTNLDFIDVHLPAVPYKDLKVWTHEVTPQGSSYSLPVQVEARQGDELQRYDLTLYSGQFSFVGARNGSQAIRDLRLLFKS